MNILNFLLLIWSVLSPFLVGACLISIFFKEKELSNLQKIALSFFVGTSIFSMILFLLSVLKISWDSLVINLTLSLFSLVILTRNISKKITSVKKMISLRIKINLLNTLLICLLIFKFFTIFYLSLDKPIFNFDAWSNWSLRAKVFYFEKGIPQNPNDQFFLGGGGHINYPLQIPILEAWIYTVLNEWDDQQVKIIFPVYLFFFTLFLYSFLTKYIDLRKTLLFTFIFVSLPFISYHASADYTDLPAGLYVGIATILLILFLQTKKYSLLVLSSLIFSFSGWVKNEGFLIFIITSIFLIFYQFQIEKKQIIKVTLALFAGFIFLVPWIIYKLYYGLGLGLSNLGSSSLSFDLSLHPEVLPTILMDLLNTSNYNLLFPSFLLGGIFILRKIDIKNIKIISFLVLVYLVFFIFVYLLTDNYVYILNGTIFQRNILIIAPSIFWITALIWGKYFNSD